MTLLHIRKNTFIVLIVLSVLFLAVANNSPAEENPSTLTGRVITAKGEPIAETPIVLFHVKIRDVGGIETIYDKTLYPFLRQRPSPPPNMPAHVRQRMMGKVPNEQEKQTRPPFLKTVTDSEGRFTFAEIASGLAQIMVLHTKPPKKKPAPPGREHLNYTPPPAIKSIKFGKVTFYPHEFSFSPETGGVTFAIKPGAKIENIAVIMGTNVRNQLTVQGKIVFKDGTPLANGSLKVNIGMLDVGDTEGDVFSRPIQTDANGDFRLSVFIPGIYSLSIEYLGLSAIADMFILKEGEEYKGLVITLDGNADELADPSPENDETEKNRYRYEPDIPKVWIVNPENGHAYKAIRCENREDARTQAEAESAHLVTITSEAEQVWLEVVFKDEPYWLGLIYVPFGSKWFWETGEPLTYTNWTLDDKIGQRLPNLPANIPGMERHYAIMSKKGDWNAVALKGPFEVRTQTAIIERDGFRAKKLDNIK